MSISNARRTVVPEKHVRQQPAAITAQLNDALAREKALLRGKSDLLQRQDVMAQEFEHRLLNSLQLIVSLLWLQSRAAGVSGWRLADTFEGRKVGSPV
jgi:two-component sensor histidine kinase